MFVTKLLKISTLILLGVSFNDHSSLRALAKQTQFNSEFEYQTGYSGIVLTIKDDLIA